MGNEKHETIADIVAKMRKRAEEVYAGQDGYPESWKDQMDYGEIYELADRIEAAHKRELETTIEKSSVVGNVTKMREALLKASVVLKDAPHYLLTDEYVNECLALIYSALAAPPRNCDKYNTDDEAYAGFRKFCDESECNECRFDQNTTTCRLSWLYSEVEKEESK